MSLQERLLARGHTSTGLCEKCWSDAAIRYANGEGPYESQTEAYYAAMKEAEESVSRDSQEPGQP